jgi:hypothetical protein
MNNISDFENAYVQASHSPESDDATGLLLYFSLHPEIFTAMIGHYIEDFVTDLIEVGQIPSKGFLGHLPLNILADTLPNIFTDSVRKSFHRIGFEDPESLGASWMRKTFPGIISDVDAESSSLDPMTAKRKKLVDSIFENFTREIRKEGESPKDD